METISPIVKLATLYMKQKYPVLDTESTDYMDLFFKAMYDISQKYHNQGIQL